MFLATALLNPIANLQMMKQVVRGPEVEPKSYMQLFKESGMKILTRGYTAHLARNYLMMTAFIPAVNGSDLQLMHAVFGLGALMISHPFEVARVMIVNGETSHITGRTYATLRTLYTNEGIAGLYKGFIPRTVQLLPVLLTMSWMIDSELMHDWRENLPLAK